MSQHDRRRRTPRSADQVLRLALAGGVLAVMIAVFLPAPGYSLQHSASAGVDAAPAPSAWSSWVDQLRTDLNDLWIAVWSPIDHLFGAATTSSSTTTSDGTTTDGSGGFDPGGGGAWLDPDGFV